MAALCEFIGLIRSCWLRVRLTLQVPCPGIFDAAHQRRHFPILCLIHVGDIHDRNGWNADKVVYFLCWQSMWHCLPLQNQFGEERKNSNKRPFQQNLSCPVQFQGCIFLSIVHVMSSFFYSIFFNLIYIVSRIIFNSTQQA